MRTVSFVLMITECSLTLAPRHGYLDNTDIHAATAIFEVHASVCEGIEIVLAYMLCTYPNKLACLLAVTIRFKSGEEHPDLAIPPETVDVPLPLSLADRTSMTDEQVRDLSDARKDAHKQYLEANSLRANLSNQVMIANAFRDDTFYLPHNLDFRGRAYTVAPHLSHIGSDLSRALLTFAESRPLGERGLHWLKVHVANLAGVDKVSFDDRVAFTEENMAHVYDTATNPFGPPLNGESVKWWRATDKPWQTLAVCMELHDALESGDPLKFESSLPVHQDGTCNGLQHYAALGSDIEGAAAVNLCNIPGSNRPSDVYMRVVDRVNEMVQAHADGNFSGEYDISAKCVLSCLVLTVALSFLLLPISSHFVALISIVHDMEK